MDDRFSQIVWAIAMLGVVRAICAAGAYSCAQTNSRYYEGMQACLNQGGSWVPQGGGGYSSSCINPHSSK